MSGVAGSLGRVLSSGCAAGARHRRSSAAAVIRRVLGFGVACARACCGAASGLARAGLQQIAVSSDAIAGSDVGFVCWRYEGRAEGVWRRSDIGSVEA